jgi:hypothetical protein
MDNIGWFERHINISYCLANLLLIGVIYLLVYNKAGDIFTSIVYWGLWLVFTVWALRAKKRNYAWILPLIPFPFVLYILKNRNVRTEIVSG